MHPLVFDYIVHQHIEDLHREAAVRRLVRRSRKHRSHVRKASSLRLQRAPAH
jgi:hypothetical protein